MSERFSKAEIKQIVEDLVEELRECDNGTVITTWQLLKAAGYDINDFEQSDLFDIHNELFKSARAEHITLDMSAHKNKLEGLSYNLDYIVKNKRAQIKCPHCGSINTARYIYGYPAFSERMQKKLDSGKWELGGCCISDVEINGLVFSTNPTRRCNDCKKDFGKPPIVISKKNETIEDIRDIVTSIKFSVGGFFQGVTDIIIKRNDKGAIVTVEQIRYSEQPVETEISSAKWNTAAAPKAKPKAAIFFQCFAIKRPAILPPLFTFDPSASKPSLIVFPFSLAALVSAAETLGGGVFLFSF